jgi:predicted dehydrogenase
MPLSKLSRKEFIGSAASSLAIPSIIPEGVIGRKPGLGANNRVVTANIGVGGMGSSHIRPDSAAICDVDEDHLAKGVRRVTDSTPDAVKDFRRILDRKDIDAVFIGTPDHWHAIMAVMAMQSGKHVYSEKPVCKTIQEGRAMLNAARKYDRVLQIGAQGRSNPNALHAARYVRNGQIGKVQRVDTWHPVNFNTDQYYSPTGVPSNLDWDMWLGPARYSDYHPMKAHFNFRWFWDYGEGFIRDRGNHLLSVVSYVTGTDDYKGIVTCEATGTPQTSGIFETPATMNVTWEFKNPDWTLTWGQPGVPNSRFPGEWGATYIGDKGDFVHTGGDGGTDCEQKAKDYKAPSGGFDPEIHFPEVSDVTERHRLNFLDCCRTGKRPVSDIEPMFHTITLCILGNIAYKLGRKVTYDYATERFIGDEAANRLLAEPYRYPWKLGA